MTFEAVILKLMPFTYIEKATLNVQFGSWSDLSAGDRIITSVEILLIVVFFYYITKLLISWRKDRKQIVVLCELLEKYMGNIKDKYQDKHLDISSEYAEMLEEINGANNKNGTNDKLEKLWKEFDESLIKKSDDNNNFIIRNSIDAEYFFNKKTMISHLGSKMFSSIPGMLLGIGLLGTFTGLYYALIQLDVGDAEKLQDSIKILINMAGVKFAASIWGLGLSVIFTFTDKVLEANLEKKLSRIQIIIDQIFIRETAEQNLDNILTQNTQQTKALNGLATSLTQKIAQEFNTSLMPKIELMNQNFHKMPEHLSTSISETFEKPLTELSDTVKNLTSGQAEKSNEALENIIREFLKELKSAAGDEGEKLKTVSSHSQEILLATSEQLQKTFVTMQSMFQEQQNLSTKRDNQIFEDLNQIKASQQEMISSLSNSVQENISTMNSEVSSNINKLIESIQLSNSEQQEAALGREMKITKGVNVLLSNIENSVSAQTTRDSQRDELSQKLFNSLALQSEEHIEKVKKSVELILDNLKTEVQNIDVVMTSASKQLIGLPNHLEKVSHSADKLNRFSNDLTTSTTKLIQFNTDFLQTQEKLDKYTQNILYASTELKTADTNLKETMQNSKLLLSDMNSKFTELADKNTTTINEFSKTVDRFMNEYHLNVAKAIKNNVIGQLDNVLGDYAHTMGEAISSLSDAIEELREKEVR